MPGLPNQCLLLLSILVSVHSKEFCTDLHNDLVFVMEATLVTLSVLESEHFGQVGGSFVPVVG